MGFFDRFTSRKGKSDKAAPKAGHVSAAQREEAAKKKAFAAVPTGRDTTPPAKASDEAKSKQQTPTAPAAPVSVPAAAATRILIRPVVTEKSTGLQKSNQYVFEVHRRATKADVRQAIHHLYGVRPVAINMLTLAGKSVRYGRLTGQTADRKKAVVTLPTGKTIDALSR